MLVPEHKVLEPDIAETVGTVVKVTVGETALVDPHTLVAVTVYTPALTVVTAIATGF
jgi:hypothetical protein